jgi:chromosome segregation ATPase
MLRRRVAQRALARAETELGLLGWQQADYDEETQRQVKQIQDVEMEQAKLMNQAAALANDIKEIQSERETSRKKYEEECKALEQERKQVLAPHDQLERQLAEKRKVEPKFERRFPELDRELREVQRRYSQLLTEEAQTVQIKNEIIHLRERSVAIPNEKTDLRTQHLRTVSEIRALETALQKEALAITALDERAQRLDDAWEARDREFVQRVRDREKERGRIEKQIQQLEFAKTHPYQVIGQVLADSNIPPMNQPAALNKVKDLRFRVDELLFEIQQSEVVSRQQDQKVVHASYLLWAGMVAGIALVLFVALT